ncbi:MAG: phage holin family protein [Synechococcales cyanobacterium T60_A2020_003]|nr:phage holin family protein [Synechococcales cyanobacterium T60_A2020_003]
MIGFLITTLVTALGLLITDFIPGVDIANFPAAIVAAIAIGFVNGFIRPVLSLLSLPINVLTLGLFAYVVNGFCFWLASTLAPGFAVHGLLAFFAGPVVLSFVSAFLNNYFVDRGLLSAEQSSEPKAN